MPSFSHAKSPSSLRRLGQLALLAAATFSIGCTQSLGDIDRTQPNLISKDHFEGQWFVRRSTIEVPPTSSATFIGEMGDMEVIAWSIEEDRLVGYRAYEKVPGAEQRAESDDALPNYQPVEDGLGDGRDPEVFKGAPIVAYPILEHVDVQREYNPRTGEQTNVISENGSDRPWYERHFMRVDWAANEAESLLDSFMFGSMAADVSSYVPEDEGGPDAFHMEVDENGDATYMDFTERRFVTPDVLGCLLALLDHAIGDCSPQKIKVRTSLLKVDQKREQDYVPLVYDDRRQGEFGYFRTERPTYDRQYGATFSGLIQLANRHELWKSSRHSDGTPKRYEDRELRAVTYTLSPNYPDDLVEVTEDMAAEYDEVMKRAAAAARGQTMDQLQEDVEADTGGDCLFCLDKNEDEHARIGDLRYNFIYWVDDPQLVGPLGYGPSSAHPETGRIVSSAAYVYGAGVDRYAATAKDIVDLLNGDLDNANLIGAEYIKDAVKGGLKSVDPRRVKSLSEVPLDQVASKALGAKATRRLNTLLEHGLPEARDGYQEARLEKVRGTPLEAMAIPDELKRTFASPEYMKRKYGLDYDPDAPEIPSLADWGTKSGLEDMSRLERVASRNNLWLEQFSDPTIVGLARAMKEAGLQGKELTARLKELIYRGVMLHEIGHTVGLRHNFGASADALNYHDEYWPLRMKTIEASGLATANSIDAWLRSNCSMIDSVNREACAEQTDGRMYEFQYSSIMDYGGRFNSDIRGLGHYDHAAIAAGYGDLVEVFDESASAAFSVPVRQAIQNSNARLSPILGQGLEETLGIHYSDLPTQLGGYENIANRKWIPRSEWDPQSQQGAVKVPYLSCYDEYVDSVETCHRWDVGADAYEITANLIQVYKEYYVFNNFQRDRIGFSGMAVMQRVATRYLLPITNMYQHWLFGSFRRSNGSPQGALATLAALEGLNTLWGVMATPNYGTYEDQGDMYVRVSEQYEDMDAGDLVIRPGDGRRQYSRFDYNSGYEVFQRVLESGHFYDQIAALIALTTSDASVVGVGTDVQADALRYIIPYYLIFDDDMNNLFSSLFRRDYASYSPRVVDGLLVHHDVLEENGWDSGVVLQAPASFSTRILTFLYGAANFDSSYNADFLQRGQLSLLGSGEERTPAEGFEVVEAQDPLSGRRYAAYRTADGSDGPWYAAEMVDDLNDMIAEYEATEDEDEKTSLEFSIANAVEELEIVRGIYELFINPVF